MSLCPEAQLFCLSHEGSGVGVPLAIDMDLGDHIVHQKEYMVSRDHVLEPSENQVGCLEFQPVGVVPQICLRTLPLCHLGLEVNTSVKEASICCDGQAAGLLETTSLGDGLEYAPLKGFIWWDLNRGI